MVKIGYFYLNAGTLDERKIFSKDLIWNDSG
jgi:hypothetical protein